MLPGRDGWLFLQNDTNDYIGQLTGRIGLTEAQLTEWRRVLRARTELVRELGVTWISQIAPEKHVVYDEHLPGDLRLADRRPAHQFMDVAKDAGAPAGYALEDLRAAKPEAQLYSRVDTHWNQRGALVAYHGICRELQRRGVEVNSISERSISWRERVEAGDLGSKLPVPATEGLATAELAEHGGRVVFDNQVIHHGAVIVFESDRDAPSAVVIGESYTNHLLVFLKESFSRMLFVHSSSVDPALLHHERPDVLITVPTERFLVRVPSDDDARERLTETASDKGQSGKLRAAAFYDRHLAGVPVDAGARAPGNLGTIPW